MGSEFGQFKEWDYKEGVEFFLEKYPLHAKLALMTKELGMIVRILTFPLFKQVRIV